MNASPLQLLMNPLAGASPVGEHLEYDSSFLELMQLSEIRPEIQFGDAIVPKREPDWQRIEYGCIEISQRTRDLRVVVLLVEAKCRLQGWDGLIAGLEVLADWLERDWVDLYPRLEETDNWDPTQRVGILSRLISEDDLIQSVMDLPIVEHQAVGAVTIKMYMQILSAVPPMKPSASNGAIASLSELERMMAEADPGTLDKKLSSIEIAIRNWKRVDGVLQREFGPGVWSGERFLTVVEKAEQLIRSFTITTVATAIEEELLQEQPQNTVTPSIQGSPMAEEVIVSNSTSTANSAIPTTTPIAIKNRSDAAAMIDLICAYFEKQEPASPVPLLLQRAKRLIPMSFVEILEELAPKEGKQLLQHLICSEKLER